MAYSTFLLHSSKIKTGLAIIIIHIINWLIDMWLMQKKDLEFEVRDGGVPLKGLAGQWALPC